jgi:hypothetical protein
VIIRFLKATYLPNGKPKKEARKPKKEDEAGGFRANRKG